MIKLGDHQVPTITPFMTKGPCDPIAFPAYIVAQQYYCEDSGSLFDTVASNRAWSFRLGATLASDLQVQYLT